MWIENIVHESILKFEFSVEKKNDINVENTDLYMSIGFMYIHVPHEHNIFIRKKKNLSRILNEDISR